MQAQNKIRIAFFGTPEFSVEILDELERGDFIPDLIVTNPDEPTGRKLIITPPPVKIWAQERNIPVFQPESLQPKANLSQAEIVKNQLSGFDLFIVVAYGKIIPEAILDLPKYGTLNVHPSLLPKYRGPSPIQSAILNGDAETGVSIMLLDKEMDHGPILTQEKIQLEGWNPYTEELRTKMAVVAGRLLITTIPNWINKNIIPIPQDHNMATFVKKISKEDGYIDDKILLNKDTIDPEAAKQAWRKIRALNPDPGTYTILESKNGRETRIKITRASFEHNKLLVEKIIPEGKKEMNWEDWKRGNLK